MRDRILGLEEQRRLRIGLRIVGLKYRMPWRKVREGLDSGRIPIDPYSTDSALVAEGADRFDSHRRILNEGTVPWKKRT